MLAMIRFEEQLLKAATLDCVFLQKDHDVLREEVADLVQPFGRARELRPFTALLLLVLCEQRRKLLFRLFDHVLLDFR